MAQEFNDSNFSKLVLDNEKVVLVDFWAEWCSPCKSLSPIIEDLSKDFFDTASIGKINVDSNPETTIAYQIRNLPTILVFKNGKVVEKIVGLKSKSDFSTTLLKYTN